MFPHRWTAVVLRDKKDCEDHAGTTTLFVFHLIHKVSLD